VGKRHQVRVVTDTNVLVSALLFGGLPGRLMESWEDGRLLPLVSAEIMQEYLRFLAYPKFQLTEAEIGFLVSPEILPWFTVVDVPDASQAYIPDDPADDKFIWCAVAGKAQYIISGDDHLLACNSCPIPIVSLAEFLKIERE